MNYRLAKLFGSFKARLSRRIVFWVFASLIVIEGIILIPSVQRKEQELLSQLKEISSGKIAWIIMTYPNASGEEFLTHVEQLKLHSIFEVILGGVLYGSEGQIIEQFGKIPKLSFEQINRGSLSLSSDNGSRYDLAWSVDNLSQNYTLVIRYNTSSIRSELFAYKIRIVSLVLLISAFVTFVTMLVLDITVISPILQLREDLLAVGEALSRDNTDLDSCNFYSLSVKRKDELGEVMTAFNQMFKRVFWEIQERIKTETILRTEQEKSERLLLNILPEPIAEQLKDFQDGQNFIADRFSDVTILFADIVNFTQLSQKISPTELVNLLNKIFSIFDRLSEQHGLEKIKTIGDAYMVASGLPIPREDHAEAVAEMALDMQQEIARFNDQNNTNLNIRIGINTGSVIAGVIGQKKFIYDLWGDAVNTASRMESHGIVGMIQVTESTYDLLQNNYHFKKRGLIAVKGKGEMTTYLLVGRVEGM